jgi:hypothetical protein
MLKPSGTVGYIQGTYQKKKKENMECSRKCVKKRAKRVTRLLICSYNTNAWFEN